MMLYSRFYLSEDLSPRTNQRVDYSFVLYSSRRLVFAVKVLTTENQEDLFGPVVNVEENEPGDVSSNFGRNCQYSISCFA